MSDYSDNQRQGIERARHARVMERAQEIFAARSIVRGNLWAESDVTGQLFMIFEKHRRVDAALTRMERAERHDAEGGPVYKSAKEAAVDDLLDIINFAVFAVRHLEGDLPDAG